MDGGRQEGRQADQFESVFFFNSNEVCTNMIWGNIFTTTHARTYGYLRRDGGDEGRDGRGRCFELQNGNGNG